MTFAARPHRESTSAVTLVNRTVEWASISPNNAYAGVQYSNDGSAQTAEAITLSWGNVADWLDGGTPGDYYIRCTNAGPDPTGGSAEDVWLRLDTTRNWYVVEVTNGLSTTSAALIIEIATDAAGSNIVASCTVFLIATVEI